MKVLVIAHKPPYPVIDGGCFASSKFLKNLLLIDKIESIDYFSLSTHKHPFDPQKFPSEIRSKVSLHGAEIDTKLKPISAFVHLIQNKSYNLSRFYQQEVENEILKIANEKNIDTVIFDGLAAAVYLKTIKKIKVKCILRAHNIEFEIWNSLKNNTTNPLKKWYLNQLTKSLKREEIEIYNALDLILTLSHDDLKQCQELTKTKTCIVPVSIESETQKTDYSSEDLCFLGAFNWGPNYEAISWFLDSIYPNIKEKTDVKIHIAGKDSAVLDKYKMQKGVVLHGFVESPSDFLKSNGIFVAPMLSGSGVKIKVLEAMNNGLPCVLTPKAAEGLKLPETFKICKTETEFTQETLRLIADENERRLLGELSRNFIREHFSMQAVSEALEAALKEN